MRDEFVAQDTGMMCSLIFLLVLELLSLQTSPCDCRHTLSPMQKPVGCFQEEISAPSANIHTGVVPTLLLTAKGDATRTAPAPRPNVRMYHACPGSRLQGRGVTPCLGTGSTRLRTRDAEADRRHRRGHAPSDLGRCLRKKERRA